MTENSRLAYSIIEAARISGISRSKFYEVVASGQVRVRKLGRRTLVLHDDLMAWLEGLPAFDARGLNRPVA